MPNIVVDTSVIINGQMISQIESGSLRNSKIIIPQVVFDELQSQASQKKEKGFLGLEKIKSLKSLSGSYGLDITISGTHPSYDDILLSSNGRIDSLITDLAEENDATLYTSDRAQHLAAQAKGIPTVFLKTLIESDTQLEFLKFFDSTTMSVHLKENQYPLGKRGKPGSFTLEQLNNTTLSKEYLEMMSSQILNLVNISDSSTLEISQPGAYVVQHEDYRIAITHPPFSDSIEITIVHPIVQLSIDDYEISDKLMARLSDRAEGIVISGAPGSGKSTLASSLANFYHKRGRIVKTFESPRDLQVDSGVAQYGKLDGSFDNTADILLLVRPDYTVFDEVRRREDFTTFADLRLTGVGMVGVVHANSPIDAIQRFIGKIELGMIPSVLDTVVFVKDGKIHKIYDLELKVKVPTGMTESDLARPVIEIKNFQDDVLEHEIYTFGEENVIVPVEKKIDKTGIQSLAEQKIKEIFMRYDSQAEVEILSNERVRVLVDEHRIAPIIGRGGSNISAIEKSLKIHLDIVPKQSSDDTGNHSYDNEYNHTNTHNHSNNHKSVPSNHLPFTFSETKTSLLFAIDKSYAYTHSSVFVNDKYISSFRVGRKGQIKIPKRSKSAKDILNLSSSKHDIQIVPKDS